MSDTNGKGGAKRLVVLGIVERPDRDDDTKTHTRWVRIGFAFANRDGSMNLYLDAFPIGSHKLQIREDDRAGSADRKSGFEAVEVRP